MSDSNISEAPELRHHSTEERRRELKAAGASAHKHLDKIKQRLKIPNLTSVETTVEPLAVLPGCIEQFRIVGLQVGPNQRMKKVIYEQWNDGVDCVKVTYTVDFQFTGYGAYCLSFEKDPGNTNLFNYFFRDIAAYGINFHRTMLFVNENLENSNTANLHRLLQDGNQYTVMPNTAYLTNLEKMVVAAKNRGIVVEVCLFVHHSVAHDYATTPAPVVLTGTASQCYQAFYNTKSAYIPMQQNLIDGVVTKLLPHWNVIYEIGNELRVPKPTADYDNSHLTAWIDWAAARIRTKDTKHLITTSTGTDNEASVNALSKIQFCSFHQGQWRGNIDGACLRVDTNYNHKHLVIDDDGGSRNIGEVSPWPKAALDSRGGCRASFNHKGISPTNRYDPKWVDAAPPLGESNPKAALAAIQTGRANSTSSCAGEY
ncbi:MAG TPA: cellulase family glycosylhydrolase [Pyrinomonadaceae bacterium]